MSKFHSKPEIINLLRRVADSLEQNKEDVIEVADIFNTTHNTTFLHASNVADKNYMICIATIK